MFNDAFLTDFLSTPLPGRIQKGMVSCGVGPGGAGSSLGAEGPSGITDSGNDDMGGDYSGGWEGVAADHALGYTGSKGYSVGSTGLNTGAMTASDVDGYGLVDQYGIVSGLDDLSFSQKAAMDVDLTMGAALGFVQDNPLGALGGVVGGVMGGLPGIYAGFKAGDFISSFSDMTPQQKAMGFAELGLAYAPIPTEIKAAATLAKNVVDPKTTVRDDVAAAALGIWGGSELGAMGAMLGANTAYAASDFVDRAANVFGVDMSGLPGGTTHGEIASQYGAESPALSNNGGLVSVGAPTDTGDLSNDKGSNEALSLNEDSDKVWNGYEFVDPSISTNRTWNGTALV